MRKYDARQLSFLLSDQQRDNYGRYIGTPPSDDLARHFHLDDTDRALIARKRGDHNRLGFAVQLGTVRYLGTFLEDPMAVPDAVLHTLGKQLSKRGELRQHYREGQEDQLGALGLVLNMIVLWNTLYMDAALAQLRAEGYPVSDEDVRRLSPLLHEHINMLGRYSFLMSDAIAKGALRPLRQPNE